MGGVGWDDDECPVGLWEFVLNGVEGVFSLISTELGLDWGCLLLHLKLAAWGDETDPPPTDLEELGIPAEAGFESRLCVEIEAGLEPLAFRERPLLDNCGGVLSRGIGFWSEIFELLSPHPNIAPTLFPPLIKPPPPEFLSSDIHFSTILFTRA